ncbi:MAG: UDP-3-O-(3-hydroxymyristoyl)glucosamine N-acyltransferase, partial [Nitrospiria bacterium]
MSTPLEEIEQHLNGQIVGRRDLLITGVAPINDAKAGEAAFITHPKYEKKARLSKASVLISKKRIAGVNKTFLLVHDPYFAFSKLLSFFHALQSYPPGISSEASIGEAVLIGEGASVAPFARIEDRARIGEAVRVSAGVFIGEGSEIGKGSLIYPNVTIREGVKIGRNVIIHSGTVIGSDGFGFAPKEGKYHKIPQVGGVVIEDDVELGANVTVDRGTLGDTVIGRGTKVDNLVQIGHNVKIGCDTILVSQVGISGSATIGEHVTLAGQVGVAGHLSVGDDVVVGGKSGITKDIPAQAVVS